MQDGNRGTIDSSLLAYLITPEELARRLRVPMSWVYDRTRKSGPERLPFYKIGRYLRFSIPEIEDYLRIKGAGMHIHEDEFEEVESTV
ncbi:MAG: helix-turn-helix domain-containing protein [Candidatus Zixiibacteriota bacterium]